MSALATVWYACAVHYVWFFVADGGPDCVVLMPPQAALEAERRDYGGRRCRLRVRALVLPPAAPSLAHPVRALPKSSSGKSDLPAMTVRDALKFSNYRSALVSELGD